MTNEEIIWLLEAQEKKRHLARKRDEAAWRRVEERIENEIAKWRA